MRESITACFLAHDQLRGSSGLDDGLGTRESSKGGDGGDSGDGESGGGEVKDGDPEDGDCKGGRFEDGSSEDSSSSPWWKENDVPLLLFPSARLPLSLLFLFPLLLPLLLPLSLPVPPALALPLLLPLVSLTTALGSLTLGDI